MYIYMYIYIYIYIIYIQGILIADINDDQNMARIIPQTSSSLINPF